MYPPNLNVPLPDPSPLAPEQTAKPDRMQQALSLITPLFALGTALGGSPMAGASFLHGAHQTLQRQDHEKQVKAHQDAQLAQQQAQLAATEQYRAQQQEMQRQQAIHKVITDTAVQARAAKTRDEYESIITANEALAGQFYGLRPNTIRAAVPYHAPNANTKMAEAGAAFLKNPANAQAIEDGKLDGSIMVDVQDDGKPLAVPLRDVLAVTPGVQIDPGTHKPIFIPKEKKVTGGVQLDDEAFLGAVEKFEAEKGRKATQKERGEIAIQTKRAMEKPTAPSTGGLPPRAQSQVNNIANSFRADPVVKRTNTVAEAFSFINSLDPNTKNPADDQAIIYAFAKAMDPDSVVREGEYATVQKYAQSWLQSFGFNAARVISSSEFLTPQARANMRQTILKKYAASRNQYDNVRKGFSRQITAATGGQADPEDYLLDYAAAMPNPQTGAAPKPVSFTVTAPNGKTYTFGSQEQMDAFKRASKIK